MDHKKKPSKPEIELTEGKSGPAPKAEPQEAKTSQRSAADDGHDPEHSLPAQLRDDIANLLSYLQYPENKRRLAEYLIQTYKELEREKIERLIARAVHEQQSEREGAKPHHKPGHLGPLMDEHLSMGDVEDAIARGLQGAKASTPKKGRR